ncbi:MAG: transposon-encoded TnpW family protein [Oscillospiraceae bacterium]|nr:transposon-encoded TnpW family protein [Oscillospiraceae bacterium]
MNNTSVYSKTQEMLVGNNTYNVTIHFNENANETAEDKMLRYISSRVNAETSLDNIGKSSII